MAIMKDVAKLAGVSVSTVSFVLNGTAKEHKVADKTAKKVLQAARDLGYQLNTSGIDRKRQLTIALFVPAGYAMADMNVITSSIQKHMKKSQKTYHVLLCLYERGSLSKCLRQMSPSEYNAAILFTETDSDLHELEELPDTLPIVLFNGTSQHFSSVNCYLNDSIAQAIRIISAKNYRRITIITGSGDNTLENETLRLLFEQFHNFGMELSTDCCISTESSLQGGAIAARQILNQEEKPELVITLNTVLAFGAIPFLARNHFIFTRDAELLCFGGAEEISHLKNYIPALSLIATPTESIAMECFSIALNLAEEKQDSVVHYECSSELILNESFTI